MHFFGFGVGVGIGNTSVLPTTNSKRIDSQKSFFVPILNQPHLNTENTIWAVYVPLKSKSLPIAFALLTHEIEIRPLTKNVETCLFWTLLFDSSLLLLSLLPLTLLLLLLF